MNKSETKLVDPFDVKPPLQQSDAEHVSDCLTKNFQFDKSIFVFLRDLRREKWRIRINLIGWKTKGKKTT